MTNEEQGKRTFNDAMGPDSDLSGMFQEHLERQQQSQAKSNEQLLGQVKAYVDTKTHKLEQQILSTDSKVDAVATSHDKLHKQVQDIQKQQNDLEQKMHLANAKAISREDVQSNRFDRPANLEVIKVSAQKYTTSLAVTDAVAPWLGEDC